MLDPRDAWNRLNPHLEPLAELPIFRRHARGRVTTKDLFATLDVPAHDVSAMDGYALFGEVEVGESRPLAGLVAAGDAPGFELEANAVAEIYTGAPVPAGADRVIPVEQTQAEVGSIRLLAAAREGAHIRRRAEIVARGSLLLAKGSALEPGTLALLATHGLEYVPVHRPPRVAFLTTGNEVVPPDREPLPGQLRDSHTDFLLSALEAMNLPMTPLGLVADRRDELRRRIESAVQRHEVVLLSGGVSRGGHDLVRDTLAELGCEILFHRIAIQPGKPLLSARHDNGALIFGLPGNPGAVMVGFWLFVRPALRRLLGLQDAFWHGALAGELAAPLAGAKDRERFLPARVEIREGRVRVSPGGPLGSHDLMSFGHGTALVRIPAHAEPACAGAPCEVLPLADWRVG